MFSLDVGHQSAGTVKENFRLGKYKIECMMMNGERYVHTLLAFLTWHT